MKQAHTLAERLKASGYKKGHVAGLLGVSRQTLWEWETGRRRVEAIDHVIALHKALGVDPRDVRPDLAELFTK